MQYGVQLYHTHRHWCTSMLCVLQRVAVSCSELQWVAVIPFSCTLMYQTLFNTSGMRCSELQWVAMSWQWVAVSCSELQWVAVSCSELQWLAVTCRELQWYHSHTHWCTSRYAIHPECQVSCSEMQWDAVRCSELQWVAVTCSRLQWVAVSCSELQRYHSHTGTSVCMTGVPVTPIRVWGGYS